MSTGAAISRDAIVYQRKCLTSTYAQAERTAMSHLVLAMALRQTGQREDARAELKTRRGDYSRTMPGFCQFYFNRGDCPGVSALIGYDWVTAQALQREARELIVASSSR